MDSTYRLQVKGRLEDRWSDWLSGWHVHPRQDGTTVLLGPVVDQAALHGIIVRIRDLGLTLMSVNLVGEGPSR